MKKTDTIQFKVIGGKKKDFEDCTKCKYAEIPEASCKVMGCIHAFNKLYDCFVKEKTDGTC